MLDKDNQHLFLEDEETDGGSFIVNVNKIADNLIPLQELNDKLTPEEINNLSNLVDNVNEVGGNLPVIATSTTEARKLSDRFSDIINVKDFGAKGDGITDDTMAIQAALDAGINRKVYFPAGVYATSPLSVTSSVKFTIEGDNAELVLNTDINSEQACLSFSGVSKGRFVYPYAIEESATKIPALDMMGVGDLVIIRGNRLVQGETRSSWTEGCVHKIVAIEDGYARLENTTHINYAAPIEIDMTVTEAIDTTHCVFGNVDADERDMLYKCVAKTGANVGTSVPFRWITEWDNITKTATFATSQGATAPSNGEYEWVNAPQVGEVYTLTKTLFVDIVTPIKVSISGLTVVGRSNLGSSGIIVKWTDRACLSSLKISSFGFGGLSVEESFRPTVYSCTVERITDASTGYGIVSRGSYAAYIHDCRMSGCRSGFSTGHAGIQDVFGVVENLFVEAGYAQSSNGEFWKPFGEEGTQAVGDHGNGWKMLFRNCTSKDISTPSCPRGYKGKYVNCHFYGLMSQGMFVQGAAGLEVYNCSWDFTPTDANKDTCLGFLVHYNWNNSEDVIIKDCRFNGLRRPLWYMDNTVKDIKNVKLYGNTVVFADDAVIRAGIGGANGVSHLVDTGCEFIDNIVYDPRGNLDASFFRPRFTCEHKDNIPVRIGSGKWCVLSKKGASFVIKTTEAVNARLIINLTAGSNGNIQAFGLMPYVNQNSDASPIAFSASSGQVCLTTADNPVANKLSVAYRSGEVIFYNNTADVRLLIEITGYNI